MPAALTGIRAIQRSLKAASGIPVSSSVPYSYLSRKLVRTGRARAGFSLPRNFAKLSNHFSASTSRNGYNRRLNVKRGSVYYHMKMREAIKKAEAWVSHAEKIVKKAKAFGPKTLKAHKRSIYKRAVLRHKAKSQPHTKKVITPAARAAYKRAMLRRVAKPAVKAVHKKITQMHKSPVMHGLTSTVNNLAAVAKANGVPVTKAALTRAAKRSRNVPELRANVEQAMKKAAVTRVSSRARTAPVRYA